MLLLLVVLWPVVVYICAVQFAWLLGRRGTSYLSTLMMFIGVSLTFINFCYWGFQTTVYFIMVESWINVNTLNISWGFYFDNLTLVMLLVVGTVSALVHLYSTDYMSHDPHLPRFMSYLSLFTFFMFILVTGDNFIILFLGWEGVGLCSYLLISFWYTRIQANKAAMKALIVNRIADLALTIGMVTIFFTFRSLDFHLIFPLVSFLNHLEMKWLEMTPLVLNCACALLLIGAMGKSAQIGLHTWLPDAMEGPTPVSALIHAATMVTAGVFLIIKCSILFEHVPQILSYVAFIGALTAFFSATVGLVQMDIKKVIAYSTCSQLGYMIFACGLSNYHVSLFHLTNHAFFKALLFLSAGAIIHSLSNEQDMRKFGGLLSLLPFTYTMFLIGSLSLMGFPFLTGFYSKDVILEIALTKYTLEGSFAYALGLISAVCTSIYSSRVLYLTFIQGNMSFQQVLKRVHELPIKMAFVLMVLSLGSIFLGYWAKDLFIGLGTDFWANNSIWIAPSNNNQLEAEFFGLADLYLGPESLLFNSTYKLRWFKWLPFFFSIFSIAILYSIYVKGERQLIKNVSDYSLEVSTLSSTNTIVLEKPQNTKPYLEIYRLVRLSWLVFLEKVVRREFRRLKGKRPKNIVIDKSLDIDQLDVIILQSSKNSADIYYQALNLNLWRAPIRNSAWKKIYKWANIHVFLIRKWYFDAIYNEIVNRPLLKFGYHTLFTSFDKGLLEIFGPFGFSFVLFRLSFVLKKMHNGKVYYYAYFIMTFLLIYLILLTI